MHLSEDSLIGKGNERLCYQHPDDKTKVIKIPYRKYRNQNRIDEIYYRHLEQQGIDFSHITRCYGAIEINGDEGLIFDRVVNSDGSIPKTLEEVIQGGVFDSDKLHHHLEDLKHYLKQNRVIFADVSEKNILCKMDVHSGLQLVIVDGLGSRHMGFKFWMQRHCTPYILYKLDKQWDKLLVRIDKCLASPTTES